MNRRESVLALAALGAAPLAAYAQQARKIPLIGYLTPAFAEDRAAAFSVYGALRAGLRTNGYIEGENIRIEGRWAQGKPETLPGFAQELVQLKADIIVAVSLPAIMAAKAASADVPIIATDLQIDPVASGLVATLARPGGNLTGFFLNHAELAAKWLQLMNEIVPGARRIAVLRDANSGPHQIAAITAAAKSMGVSLQVLEFRDTAGIQSALNAGLKAKPEALVQLARRCSMRRARRLPAFWPRIACPASRPTAHSRKTAACCHTGRTSRSCFVGWPSIFPRFSRAPKRAICRSSSRPISSSS